MHYKVMMLLWHDKIVEFFMFIIIIIIIVITFFATMYGEWRLAVWLSGNALASINVVALRQTRLVSGWVTVCGRVNQFCM